MNGENASLNQIVPPTCQVYFLLPYAGLVPNCCLVAWMLQGLAWWIASDWSWMLLGFAWCLAAAWWWMLSSS